MLKRHLLTFMSVSLFLTNQTHARIVFFASEWAIACKYRTHNVKICAKYFTIC